MGLTIAGLASVSTPGLHPPAGALAPRPVPHRVLPHLAHRHRLSKLPGWTLTVASGRIKSSWCSGLRQTSLVLIIFC